MARIRTVKPEFWEDAIIGTLSREARLLFIASWNLADDAGRLRWSPAYLKAGAFIYDEDISQERVSLFMDELAGSGLVTPYESGRGKQHFACIVNFLKHQKISHPTPSRLPEPPNVPYGTLANDSGKIQSDSEFNPQEVEVERERDMEVDAEMKSGFVDEWFEQLSKAHPRAERGPAAQNQFLEALQWKTKRQGWTPQEAARYLVRRANDYREQTTYWTGLERWLRNKVFEQDWSDSGKPSGKGEQQFNRIDAERKKAIAAIRAE